MKIDRVELLRQLQILRPAIKSGGMIPELSHVWFSDGRARAFDGESLGVSVPVPVDIDCGLPGPVLLGLLGTSKLPEASVESEDSVVTVKMGRSRTKLASLESDRSVWPFPDDDDDPSDSIEISESIILGLKRVLVVEPKIVTRLEHRGVLVYRDDDRVTLCATDSATVATVGVSCEASAGDVVMLPRNFAEQIVKNCGPGDVLDVYDEYLAVDADGVSLCARTVDSSDVQDIMRVADDVAAALPEFVPAPAGLGVALERAVILEGKDEAIVDVQISGGDLVLSGSYRYGDLNEKMKLKAKHPPVHGQFTASLIRRGLASPSQMAISEDAIVLRSSDDDFYAVAPRNS